MKLEKNVIHQIELRAVKIGFKNILSRCLSNVGKTLEIETLVAETD